MKIVKELKVCKETNEFQELVLQDMKILQTSKNTLTPTDKTSNIYRLNNNNYQNLLRNAITASYKKANENIGTKINKKGITFVKLEDKIKIRLDKIEMNGIGSSTCYFKRTQRKLYEPSYYKAHKSI